MYSSISGYNIRRFILALLFNVSISVCYSQNINISSFKLLDSDLTANTAGTMEQDQNGDVAALIKVVTTQTGFSYDCGAMGVVKTLQKPSEIWVYVPHGVKKMTIAHPNLGLLRDYYFPIPIEAARTYELVLVSGTVQTIVKQTSRSQYLVLKVTPPDAIVELDNEILPTSNGVAQKFVRLGTYDYRIQAQDYHVAAGKVTVDDPNSKKILEINLQPAFGWIEIPANKEYNGAQVFIDNTLAGTIPMKSKNLASGEHSIKIVKELYHPFSQKVLVKDNETTQIIPNLSANFSEVTITVDNDADIYVNEEKKGKGSWIGKLASGTYLIEAKKEGHRNSSQTIDVHSSESKKYIKLSTPIPIYGEIDINSIPNLANVVIDGKSYGQTPVFLPHFLIGKHHVLLSKDGYSLYETDIEVDESHRLQLSVKMQAVLEKQSYYGYSFKPDETGNSAYATTFPVFTNGRKTALIKIFYEKTGLNKFSFECPGQTIAKVDNFPFQYNIYVPEGTKNLKIKSNTNEEIYDIHFDTDILSGYDYRLNLFKNTEKYNGKRKNGMKDGYGIFESSDGNRYEGEWVADKMQGNGTMYWANGDRYEGEWEDDKMQGIGTMYWANGDRYEGEWEDGLRVGEGTFYRKDGILEKGAWQADELCKLKFRTECIRCTIRGIEKKGNATIVHMAFNNIGNDSEIISISPNSYLETTDGTKLKIRKAQGIALDPKETDVEENSIVEFSLVYPPLPVNVTKLNLIDDLENSYWNFYDIEL